jgi:anthranilate phosphoribosyltransferase
VAGRPGPVRDTALLNAGAALAAEAGVAGPEELAAGLADGLRRATAAVDSGAAEELLDRWIATSQRLAAAVPD